MNCKTMGGALLPVLLSIVLPAALAQNVEWHQASDAELGSLLPTRVSVNGEHIETEMRTASGILNRQGQALAAVVLITAGYSDDARFSHYLIVQSQVKIDGIALLPGEYVFGWKRKGEELSVNFYQAKTGTPVGTAEAHRLAGGGRVEILHIWPPEVRSLIEIGPFAIPYEIRASDPPHAWSYPHTSVGNVRGMNKMGLR